MNIPDYPNYLIYEDGRVFSKKRNKFLTPQISKEGYYKLTLYPKVGKRTTNLVHRLVALAHIPNPKSLPMVDHIDRNKINNHINNLRWVNAQDNCLNKGEMTCCSTNEKNISYVKKVSKFRVYKYFDTLEEAIKYRDENKLSL